MAADGQHAPSRWRTARDARRRCWHGRNPCGCTVLRRRPAERGAVASGLIDRGVDAGKRHHDRNAGSGRARHSVRHGGRRCPRRVLAGPGLVANADAACAGCNGRSRPAWRRYSSAPPYRPWSGWPAHNCERRRWQERKGLRSAVRAVRIMLRADVSAPVQRQVATITYSAPVAAVAAEPPRAPGLQTRGPDVHSGDQVSGGSCVPISHNPWRSRCGGRGRGGRVTMSGSSLRPARERGRYSGHYGGGSSGSARRRICRLEDPQDGDDPPGVDGGQRGVRARGLADGPHDAGALHRRASRGTPWPSSATRARNSPCAAQAGVPAAGPWGAYRQLLRAQPDDEAAFRRLARLYEVAGAASELEAIAAQRRTAHPNDLLATLTRAKALRMRERFVAAEHDELARALEAATTAGTTERDFVEALRAAQRAGTGGLRPRRRRQQPHRSRRPSPGWIGPCSRRRARRWR